MKYGAIYLDPPWAFKTFSGNSQTPHRSENDHYATMQRHEIAGLPIPDLAAKSCALFMWTVDSHLDESLDLMRMWGFKYKTIAFVWEKTAKNGEPRIGMGYWTRKQGEVCLLATRGTPRRKDKGVRQFHREPRREHSRKPDEFYERIERLVDGPYLEMFARQRREGWDVLHSDEPDKFEVDPHADQI